MKQVVPEELVSAYLDGEVTAEERAMVEDAMAESPELRRLYRELLVVQGQLRGLPEYRLDERIAQRILARVEQEIVQPASVHRESGVEQGRGWKRWQTIAVALSSVAAILLFAALLVLRSLPMKGGSDSAPMATLEKTPLADPHSGRPEQLVNSSDRPAVGSRTRDSLPQDTTQNVGLSQNPTFVMVMDLTITAEGQRARVFDDALARAGVRRDPEIHVDDKLERALLASRFIGDVEKAEVPPRTSRNATSPEEIEMTYVTGPGLRVDAATRDLKSRPASHIMRWRFDMAIEPPEREMFKLLDHASRMASHSSGGEFRAHRLTFRFSLRHASAAFMGSMARPLIRAELAQPKGSRQEPLAAPDFDGSSGGANAEPRSGFALSGLMPENQNDEICAVLFILRNVPENRSSSAR